MQAFFSTFPSILWLLCCGTLLFGCDSSSPECVEGETQNTGEVCGLNGEGEIFVTCVEGTFSSENGCTGTDICVNDEVQEGTTVCGFNSEGLLSQDCVKGQWVDNEECSGDDICINGEVQEGSTSCGLNDEGIFMEDCVDGAWVENTDCSGNDICVNEESREGTTVCGLNDEGVLMQFCEEGTWVDNTTCTGTDLCINGETQEGSNACGLNEEGVFMEDCTEGAWVENDTCSGTDVCVNGEIQDTETICGLNSEGILTQDCTEGAWVDGACTGTDVCVNGEAQEGPTVCGLNSEGVFNQDCTEGAWVDNETCTGTDICVNESTQESETVCGLNNEGFLLDNCTDGLWAAGEVCSGTDLCTNGEIQDGTTVCGFNDDGFLLEECVAGVWQTKENSAGCQDFEDFIDSVGDTCQWYNDAAEGNYLNPSVNCIETAFVNDDGIGPFIACCACGGGTDVVNNECSVEADCINGSTQKGESPCGLNGEGGLMQDCVQGVWVDNETCEGATHICVNDTTEDSEVACGLNDEGFGKDICQNGEWQAFETGDNICVDFYDFKDSEGDNCGNYSGWWSTSCDEAEDFVNADGVSAAQACCKCGGGTSTCTGDDDCTNDSIQIGEDPEICGLNNEGFFEELCVEGVWEETSECSGNHVCVNGESRPSTEETCATGAPQKEDCAWGQWQPQTQWYQAQCSDDDTFADINGSFCAQYTLTPELCDEAEDLANAEGLDATEACCECGGGTSSPFYNGPTCFQPYLIKGVMDFGLPSTNGKALHFVVHEDIADLSIYGVGVANNGEGTDGQEYTFPAISVTAGQHVLLARNIAAMETYFGACFVIFDHTLDANIAISQNGNDAIELFKNGEAIQTYGNLEGSMPNYEDAWAFQNWGSNFNTASSNCTDGATTIFDAACLYPSCEPFVVEEE